MADLTDIQAAQSVKIIGATTNGTETTPLAVDTHQTAQVGLYDSAGAVITSSTIASKKALDTNSASSALATYSASISGLTVAQAAATDFLTIVGSTTKKVIINQINISGIQTTASVETLSLIKRSTLNTGGGTGTIIQTQNSFTSASSTTATVTVTSTGSGNLLVIASANLDNRTVTAVSDGTNAFTQAASAAGNSGGQNGQTDIWYLLSSTAGETTITVTYSGLSTTKELYFWEVSGSGIAFQTANNTRNQTIAATDSGATVTTTAVGFIVGAIVTGSGSTGVITASPAPSNTRFTNGIIGNSGKSAAEWVLGPIGTYTPTYSDSGSGAATGSSTAAFTVIGNTVPTITAVSHDSSDAAATAQVSYYFANPTLGTAVGNVRNVKSWIPTSVGQPGYVSWTFTDNYRKGVILNNANESLNINLNGLTVPGSSFSIDVVWTEQ